MIFLPTPLVKLLSLPRIFPPPRNIASKRFCVKAIKSFKVWIWRPVGVFRIVGRMFRGGREWWDVMWFWLREKKNNERSIILVIEVKRRWSETGGWVLPESNVMARPWNMVVLETTYSFWKGLFFRCYVSAREGSHEVFTIKWLWSESDTKW